MSISLLTVFFSGILFLFAASKQYLLSNDIADLGLFEQFIWLIANGKINTVASLAGRPPLQDHFSLLLIPISFIYKLIPSTYTLLGLQSIALGVLPGIAYKSVAKQGGSNLLVFSFVFSIILCPYIFLINLANFHPEVVTIPFMLIAILESRKERKWVYFLSLLVSLFAKKAQVLYGVGLSLYTLKAGKTYRSIITLLISIVWWLISSKFSAISGDFIQLRLGYLGSNNFEIVRSLITQPWLILNEASLDSIFLYTLGLFLPFLCLITRRAYPAFFGLLPIYFTNIISASSMQRDFGWHYSAGIIPFMIAACIDSSVDWKYINGQRLKVISNLSIVLVVISFIGYARIGYFQSRYIPRFKESVEFHKFKTLVRTDGSVLTNDNYTAHFANREKINTYTSNYLPISEYDYIVLPEKNNIIKGRKKLLLDDKREGKVKKIIRDAEVSGMSCILNNKYIRFCAR